MKHPPYSYIIKQTYSMHTHVVFGS